jgi:hypothetical protein
MNGILDMSFVFDVPREWKGQTTFILGGGPSLLAAAQIVDLKDELRRYGRIIAINDAFLLSPYADVLFFADIEWFDDNKNDLSRFEGGRIITRCCPSPDWQRYVKRPICRVARNMAVGLSKHSCAVAGWCGGSNATNLAYLFGSTRIVLLGFDMKGKNWHQRHKRDKKPDCYKQDFIPHFLRMAKCLQKERITVINTTKGSAMTCFPYQPLGDVLSCGN